MNDDEQWMSLAIKQAIKAEKEGEVDTIILDNKGTNPVLDITTVKAIAKQILSRKVGDIITRDELFPKVI